MSKRFYKTINWDIPFILLIFCIYTAILIACR